MLLYLQLLTYREGRFCADAVLLGDGLRRSSVFFCDTVKRIAFSHRVVLAFGYGLFSGWIIVLGVRNFLVFRVLLYNAQVIEILLRDVERIGNKTFSCKVDQLVGIDGTALIANFEMKMTSVRASCISTETDHFSRFHILVGINHQLAEVS